MRVRFHFGRGDYKDLELPRETWKTMRLALDNQQSIGSITDEPSGIVINFNNVTWMEVMRQ